MTKTGRILAVGLMALVAQAGVNSPTGTRSAISRLPDGGDSCPTWGCGENHSETMVSDATSVQQPEGSLHSLYAPKMAGCPEGDCGMNHNETLVNDVPLLEQPHALSQWLANVQAFVLATFTNNAPVRDWCENWGCGSNHNETLLSDSVR
jgi:hypothetical protein